MPSDVSRRLAVLTLATGCMFVQMTELTFAGHAGAANSGSPDNAVHCIDRNTITAKIDAAVQHGAVQLNLSDMEATFSCSGDVEVYDAHYGTSGDWNGFAGRTNCDAYVPLS